MIIEAKTKQVWVVDGKEFTNHELAIDYIKQKQKETIRIKNLKVYQINSDFDSTEGRGYYRHTTVFTDQEYPIILQYAFDEFGPPLKPWYGNGFYTAWTIGSPDPRNPEEILMNLKSKENESSYKYHKFDIVVISTRDVDYPGLPKSVFPWPVKRSKA